MKDRSDFISHKNGLFRLLLTIKKHFLLDFRKYYEEVFLFNFRLTVIFYK